MKLIRPTKQTFLVKSFLHLNILCLPKLYTLSVGKFMRSYWNKQLPNHFVGYFIPVSWIHPHVTRLSTSNIMFLPRLNSFPGKCALAFVGPKIWSTTPHYIKSYNTTLY